MKLVTIAMFLAVLLISGFTCPDREFWEERSRKHGHR